jgi:hypothetical protein
MNHELPSERLPPFFHGTLAVLVGLFVMSPVLQAFMPHDVGTALIALRSIVVPGCIAAFVFTWTERILFAAILFAWVLVELLLRTQFDTEDLKVLLSVLGCLPYLKGGMILATSRRSRFVWHGIMLSVFLLNLLTISIYVDTVLGGSLGAEVLDHSRREGEDPFFRFSFGNPIEVPAFLALATAASSRVLGPRAQYVPYALLANLAGSFISQSRMVLAISCYAVLQMWQHFRTAAGMAMVAALVAGAFSQFVEVKETWNETWHSISERFTGDDSNSGRNRVEKFLLVLDNANTACLTIGNGINSSVRLSGRSGLGYNSVESVLLQEIYESGLLRLIALALFITYTIRRAGIRLQFRGEFVLGAVQVFLLNCVNGYTPLYVFCLGAVCVLIPTSKTPAVVSNATVGSDKTIRKAQPRAAQAPVVS